MFTEVQSNDPCFDHIVCNHFKKEKCVHNEIVKLCPMLCGQCSDDIGKNLIPYYFNNRCLLITPKMITYVIQMTFILQRLIPITRKLLKENHVKMMPVVQEA